MCISGVFSPLFFFSERIWSGWKMWIFFILSRCHPLPSSLFIHIWARKMDRDELFSAPVPSCHRCPACDSPTPGITWVAVVEPVLSTKQLCWFTQLR